MWKVEFYQSCRLVFPVAAAITHLRLDMVIRADAARILIIGELTTPWKEHLQETNERKKAKYAHLVVECV